ncbi:IS3 family transposase (plasmid) [Streptosporangium sp. NBC_01495]|uniref:IS3 family transposase n=1 Tax=Streptosporangium sp. NBC_01495 TaxID=2903899 RepID=UPI002E34F492|nr:IS3 family transposase [Streptosporangium sp. NBC_01495]
MAGFIAAQRAEHGVAHAVACRALGVSQSWFYKWSRRGREGPGERERRRAGLIEAVVSAFHQRKGTEGSPRITARLRRAGWRVSKNTVAKVMAERALAARPKTKRKNTTRPGRGRWRAEDHLRRDFTAPGPDVTWCGDGTEIPTAEGALYLAATEDLFSRRVLGFAMSAHKGAALATASLQMAVALRGGGVAGVRFHSDQGSEYTAADFRRACERMGIVQSMGRVGSALEVSRRRGSHPPPLSEPCLKVSLHTAPVVEPVGNAPCRQ